MNRFHTFLSAVLAGAAIGIGGLVFLALDNKVLGALFFCVGLFTICTFGFSRFTGKVCNFFDNDRNYRINLLWICLGNLAGIVNGRMILCLVLISVEDEDHRDAIAFARRFYNLGIKIYATRDTAAAINKAGIPCLTSLDTAEALADIIASRFSLENTELVDINHMDHSAS